MELSDINNPLLKQLSTEAPSSYSHSLLMASMSEKAVSAIGGDTLLTRVGCLYHDIGKMLNAGIYAENKNLEDFSNSAIGYTPEEYARTIIRHVNDGIELGRQHRLPEKIISFIPEHHGTSLMHYFYHETLKKISGKRHKPPDKKLFQYPGPKPQSKETAIVMIADSIEAASRSIIDPSKENYIKLIENIIKIKNDEGQLDECNLTMNEVRIIKDSFLETLLSTFHMRPKYPSKSRTRQLEKKLNKKPGKAKNA
jgi:putative nucleotidyltransferase with HDIG domain